MSCIASSLHLFQFLSNEQQQQWENNTQIGYTTGNSLHGECEGFDKCIKAVIVLLVLQLQHLDRCVDIVRIWILF